MQPYPERAELPKEARAHCRKFLSQRARNSKNPLVLHWIKEIEASPFYVETRPAKGLVTEICPKQFTIILTVHNINPRYLQECLQSIADQTYSNVEIVLIDHGTTGTVKQLIRNFYLTHSGIKLITVDKNLYDPTAGILESPFIKLINAGLFISEGSFSYFLSCDDLVSSDYCEKMVSLFEANPQCKTASASIVSINENSQVNDELTSALKSRNDRGRYTDSEKLIASIISGGSLFSSPGGCMAYRSSELIELGGFDLMSDFSQVFRLGIFGQSGFDKTANLFWRHHNQQTNKLHTAKGVLTIDTSRGYLQIYNLRDHWRAQFGPELANAIEKFYYNYIESSAISLVKQVFSKNPGIDSWKILLRVLASEHKFSTKTTAAKWALRITLKNFFKRLIIQI